MAGLPPPPINDKPGSFTWLEWYRQLRNYVSTSGSVPWYIINFSGSNITDIAQRSHNNMQSLQGGSAGEMYHLSQTDYNKVSTLGTASQQSGLSVTITTAKLTALGTDGSMTFVDGVLTSHTQAT